MFSVSYVKGSSSITRIQLHVMFKTKYCHKVFELEEFKNRCEEIFVEVAAKQQVIIEEIGFDKDHVHMVWLTKIYHRVDILAKIFKGTAGRKLLKEFPEIKKQYFWGSGLWSGVIFADAIGKNPETVKRYVKNQGAVKGQAKISEFMPPVYSEHSSSSPVRAVTGGS